MPLGAQVSAIQLVAAAVHWLRGGSWRVRFLLRHKPIQVADVGWWTDGQDNREG